MPVITKRLEVAIFVKGLPSKLKTEINEALFFCGYTDEIAAKDVALRMALSKKGITTEELLKSRGVSIPKWNIEDPRFTIFWDKVSEICAMEASGKIRVILGKIRRIENTFEVYELPALKKNPRVTRVTAIDPKTGVEKILHQK